MKHFISLLIATLVLPLHAAVQLEAGHHHSLVLKKGKVFSMGLNNLGQLGYYSGDTYEPSEVATLEGVSKVEAEHYRSIALLQDGTVRIWGYQAGDTPALVANVSDVTDVAVNDFGGYIVSGGIVYKGWSADFNTWQAVPGMEGVDTISASGKHILALTSDGRVYSFGDNSKGQLGLGHMDSVSYADEALGLADIVQISAGTSHSTAVDSAGNVFTWGNNYQGRLCRLAGSSDATPGQVFDTPEVRKVKAGYNQTVALKKDGTVWACGWHNYIGSETYNRSSVFVQIPEIADAVEIDAGGDHILVATETEVYGWGGNTGGKLGVGDSTERHSPDLVPVPEVADPEPAPEDAPITQQCDAPTADSLVMDLEQMLIDMREARLETQATIDALYVDLADAPKKERNAIREEIRKHKQALVDAQHEFMDLHRDVVDLFNAYKPAKD